MVVFARIWARFALGFWGCPLSPPCQQKLFARSVDSGDKKLETTAILWYTGGMPRRIRDYLDRLSHRDTHREEPNTYTVNTTVNLNDWQPVRWNATQWFPDNEDTPARVYHHDMDDPAAEVFPGRTVRPSEALRRMLEENMTVRDYEELASRNFNDYVVPENMLRLVRLSMPNITRNTLVEERPMDPPDDWSEAISRATRIPASYLYPNEEETYRPNRNVVYSEYTPSWSNRTINWWANDKGHVEFRRGRIIRVKRYCKI